VIKLKLKEIKKKTFDIIENSGDGNTASRIFDISLVTLIIVNLVLVIADTFELPGPFPAVFEVVELLTMIVFTIEYALRIWTADMLYPGWSKTKARLRYMVTFIALIDLFAILPFYIPLIITIDLRVLMTLRVTRLLRLFKVKRHADIFSAIREVLKKRIGQLLTSMLMIFMLMIVTSVLMYNIEHAAQPDKFNNAFSGFWWAVSTLTTIGYGDIYPITVAGQVLNWVFSFLGIGIVAIPTGIISAGFVEYFEREREDEKQESDEKCFCPYCGHKLDG